MYSLVLVIWSAIICGKLTSAIQNRIYFGNDTTIEDYPYQVALLDNYEFYCGGSLITPLIVLTAAHCVQDLGSFYIRAGSKSKTSGGELVPVQQYLTHPQFNAKTLDYDVAVLKLNYPVTLDYVSKIELQPLGITLPDGTEATVTGWGKTENLDTANVLQSLIVKKISQADCANLLKDHYFSSRMTCYDTFSENSGVCSGDSGSPLVVNNKQVGIASWVHNNKDCGNPIYPDVYVRIEHPSINLFIQNSVNQFSK